MWRAYLVACAGTFVMLVLSDPSIKGWKVIAFAGFAVILWAFSVFEAVIAMLNVSRETLEAQAFNRAADPSYRNQSQITKFEYSEKSDLTFHGFVMQFPVDAVRLKHMADLLLSGVSFSEKAMVKDANLFTYGEWRKLQPFMELRGLVGLTVPGSPKQGMSLTRAGVAIMREIKKRPTSLPTGLKVLQ